MEKVKEKKKLKRRGKNKAEKRRGKKEQEVSEPI